MAQPVTRPHGPPSIMAEAAAREARGGKFFLRAFFSVEKIVMTFWRDEDCGKPCPPCISPPLGVWQGGT